MKIYKVYFVVKIKFWDREVIPDICTVVALYKRSVTSAHKLQLVSFRSETSDTS
jgi:hypothetical protein